MYLKQVLAYLKKVLHNHMLIFMPHILGAVILYMPGEQTYEYNYVISIGNAYMIWPMIAWPIAFSGFTYNYMTSFLILITFLKIHWPNY
jgi:hypothetical protein